MGILEIVKRLKITLILTVSLKVIPFGFFYGETIHNASLHVNEEKLGTFEEFNAFDTIELYKLQDVLNHTCKHLILFGLVFRLKIRFCVYIELLNRPAIAVSGWP